MPERPLDLDVEAMFMTVIAAHVRAMEELRALAQPADPPGARVGAARSHAQTARSLAERLPMVGLLPRRGCWCCAPSASRRRRARGHVARVSHLRQTLGTRMPAAGVPMRTLQEWMGHRDLSATQRYADYAPSPHEGNLAAAAFTRNASSHLSAMSGVPGKRPAARPLCAHRVVAGLWSS